MRSIVDYKRAVDCKTYREFRDAGCLGDHIFEIGDSRRACRPPFSNLMTGIGLFEKLRPATPRARRLHASLSHTLIIKAWFTYYTRLGTIGKAIVGSIPTYEINTYYDKIMG